jgi:phage replication O-like protein O
MSFSSPNYTQMPNDLFDVHMRDMGDAELRVVIAVVRKTFGFHKERTGDAISLTQIQQMTGLSRQGALDGISQAIEHDHIEECGHGKRGVKRYRPVIRDDPSGDTTSQASRPVDDVTGQRSRPVDDATGQASRHTKERVFKEKNLYKERRAEREKSHPQSEKAESVDGEAPDRVTGIIQAWLDGLDEAAPLLTDTPENRAYAARLVEAGYSAQTVKEFFAEKLKEGFWQEGKTPMLSTACKLMPGWLSKRNARQARKAKPSKFDETLPEVASQLYPSAREFLRAQNFAGESQGG